MIQMPASPSRASQSRPGSWAGLMTSLLHFSIAHLLCFSQFRVLCEGWGAGLALSQGEPTVGMGRPPSIPSRNQQDPGQAGQGSASSRSGKGALTFARSLAAAALSTSPKRGPGPSPQLGVGSRRFPGRRHLPPAFRYPRPNLGLH